MAHLNNRNDYSEVAIKLGLIKEGVPIYRHIPCHILDLSMPSAQHGRNTLKRLAVPLLVGHNGTIDLRHYLVELTYHDTDGDMVLILNDGDIIGALKEFVQIGKVKILAKVSTIDGATMNHSELVHPEYLFVNRGCQMGLSAVAAQGSSYSVTANAGKSVHTVVCEKSKHSDQKMDYGVLPTNKVLYEFGSCIAVLLNVVAKMVKEVSTSPTAEEATHRIRQIMEAIEEQTKNTYDTVKVTNPLDVRFTTTSEVILYRPASNTTNSSAINENDKQPKDALHFVVSDPILLTNDDVTVNESDGIVPTTSFVEAIRPSKTNVVHEYMSTHPSIHQGYECDGCFTNPIVGKRYRLYGASFYFCEKCMANYVGNKQFEEAHLDVQSILQK